MAMLTVVELAVAKLTDVKFDAFVMLPAVPLNVLSIESTVLFHTSGVPFTVAFVAF